MTDSQDQKTKTIQIQSLEILWTNCGNEKYHIIAQAALCYETTRKHDFMGTITDRRYQYIGSLGQVLCLTDIDTSDKCREVERQELRDLKQQLEVFRIDTDEFNTLSYPESYRVSWRYEKDGE